MARPRLVHHDERPDDELDFGKTRLYDELDAQQHEAELERDERAPRSKALLHRLSRRRQAPSSAQSDD